jgi:hypothetical protein
MAWWEHVALAQRTYRWPDVVHVSGIDKSWSTL